MGDEANLERPSDEQLIDEVAELLNLSEADKDALTLSNMEKHERAAHFLTTVRGLGHRLSIMDGDEVFVNVAWLGTLLLMEADFTMKGLGGCPPHMRVLELLETTILASVKNIEELDTTTEGVVD